MRTIEINGNNFSNMEGFYQEIERKMTSGLGWEIGRNLNALNDGSTEVLGFMATKNSVFTCGTKAIKADLS